MPPRNVIAARALRCAQSYGSLAGLLDSSHIRC